MRFKTVFSALAIVLISAPTIPAQSDRGKSQQDIVETLLPNGAIPKSLSVKPDERAAIIKKLKLAQVTAHAQRAQQVAFLLAALDAEYDHNRDYLLHVLSGCNYPEIRYDCDDMTGFYLIYLYEHGHPEILAPLLKTSIGTGPGVGSYSAAGSEGLGSYFAEQVQKAPERFLGAVSTFPVPTQKKACAFAGSSDGGGLGPKGLAQARRKLRGIGTEVALRCLKEIELANKP